MPVPPGFEKLMAAVVKNEYRKGVPAEEALTVIKTMWQRQMAVQQAEKIALEKPEAVDDEGAEETTEPPPDLRKVEK